MILVIFDAELNPQNGFARRRRIASASERLPAEVTIPESEPGIGSFLVLITEKSGLKSSIPKILLFIFYQLLYNGWSELI